LDLGGGGILWDEVVYPSKVTLVNVDPGIPAGRYELIVADAINTGFEDRSFSLAFSNSLIEHVGDYARQGQLANEIRRLSDQIWCQTPNRWFPIEPHYLGLFIHWLPRRWQMPWMIRYFTIWGLAAKPDRKRIIEFRNEVRLLSRREVKKLFPDCEILTERVFGIPKSFVAVKTVAAGSSCSAALARERSPFQTVADQPAVKSTHMDAS
jgi:hypothetical protein